jgi:hypothetical protein
VGSGLILLLIVGAWLAVLVPVALRSHEASSALATVDKFSDAMRVLSRRRGAAQGGGSRGAAQGGGSRGAAQGGGSRGAAQGGGSRGAVRAPNDAEGQTGVDAPASTPESAAECTRRPGPTPAVRRLRALVALVVGAVATLVGALVGSLWLLVPHLVTDLVLLGFVCWLRSQAVAREEREWRRAMGERRPVAPSTSVRVHAPRGAAAVVAPPVRVAGLPDRMPSRASLDPAPQRLVAVPAARIGATPVRGAQGEPWQPVPVPVPTYVSAPAAPRRVLDLTRPAAAASLSSAERSLGIDDSGPELDHILGRRAVGD